MSDTVTVRLTRREYEATLAAVAEKATERYSNRGGPPLDLLDVQDALRKLEAVR